MTFPTIWFLADEENIVKFAGVQGTRASAEDAMTRKADEHQPKYFKHHTMASVGNRPYGDEWEAQRWQEHFGKYDRIADQIDVVTLCRMVPFSVQSIRDALAKGDEHLNSLPLVRWDSLNNQVRSLLARAHIKAWSLGDTVCVLKHVARHCIAPERITF